MAIGSFFEGGNEPEAPSANPRSNLDIYNDENSEDEDPDYKMPTEPIKPKTQAPKPKQTRSTGGGARIYTLRDHQEDEDDEDDEDKGEAFYAGGSETSGQQILGPAKKKAENIIQDLFRQAKEYDPDFHLVFLKQSL